MAIIFRCVLEHSDIIGLLIDLIALIVSTVLTFIIYKLERRHEEEHEAAEEKAQKMAMAEAAKVFLLDNDDEVEYLPLAEIAAKLNLKRKHCRSITTRFLRCSEAQQREILHQANIADIQVSTEAVSAALKSLQSDLDKFFMMVLNTCTELLNGGLILKSAMLTHTYLRISKVENGTTPNQLFRGMLPVTQQRSATIWGIICTLRNKIGNK